MVVSQSLLHRASGVVLQEQMLRMFIPHSLETANVLNQEVAGNSQLHYKTIKNLWNISFQPFFALHHSCFILQNSVLIFIAQSCC